MAWECFRKDVLPFTAIVAVECTSVGLKIHFKAATLRGMSYYVFITYSYAVATLILLPFPLIFRSTAALPSSKFPLISRICLLGLIGYRIWLTNSGFSNQQPHSGRAYIICNKIL
ncbi:hypothetical protein SCA6_017809 [Theobroma cacao]